ncbi:MAG: hypothetical protein E7062_06080, partial [Spirochaetaceae bacterium]|nr:hypothetical protein [Spirochaetaceae bacterium]
MKRKVLLIIGFIVSLFAVSCNNIGLGEAIDTESPVISITSPNVGAVIRDKFAIKGVYSDDGQIKSIKLNLENLETGDSKIYDATYSKDSYTFVVDALAEGIKDGNYAANITITDTYGHSTQTSATYIIDNTAPVIILSRPESKKGSEAFDVFGQEFKIEGRAHDDNKFDIEIQIFDEKNEITPLLTKTLKNVNRSIGLTVLDAKTAIEEYEKVYGKISQDKNEDKRLYCKIIARDESKRYPASESDILKTDNIGNEISTYYLESEFEEVIRASYSATDLYKMINGTFDSTGRQIDESITENDVKKLLNENKIEVGQFSLNPANNPSFEVTNFNAPLNKDGKDFEGEDYKLTRGSTITIKVNSGLDGTYIPGKSLGVYVIECDKNGKINEGATPIWLVKPEIDKDGAEVKLTEEELKIRESALDTQIGVEKSKSYTFKSIDLIPSKTGMMVGRNYLICVEGYDTNKSIVSNFNKDYGFYFAPKDSAPSLTLEEPVANTTYLKKDSKLKVKGFSVTEMGNPTIDICVDGKVVKTLEKADLIITGNDDLSNTSSFEYEIPATDFDQIESKEYVISIVAEMDGKETVKEKTVSYDIDSPEILIQSVTPIVVKNEKNNLNKNAEVKGSITDLFTGLSENLKYFVYQDDVEKLSGQIQTPSNFTVNVDTTKLTDEKDVVIKIYSEDKAGNSFEVQETYFVNQSTDIPNVDPNDDTWKKDINSEKALQDSIAAGYKNNIFSSGGSIVVKCSDDDGIDTVIVKIKDKDDSKQEFKVNGYPLESLISYTLPTQSGRNGVEVTVKDKFGVEETQVVWVQVTGTNPKVECSVTPEYFTDRTNVKEGTPNQITVTGISEGADPFTIEILDAEGNYSSTTIVDVSNDGSWKKWTHSFVPKKDDISIVRYKIIDQWGLFTEVEVPFKVDKVAPLVTIADMPSEEATEGDNFRFKGTASDVGSVVEKVELSFDDGKTWQEAIGTKNWSHTSIFVEESAFNTEGKKTLKVRVSDTAGNYSEIETKDFVFDKAAPTVAIEKYNGNTISGASIDIQEAFSLSGSSFDGYGIETLSLAQNKDGEEKSEIKKDLTPTTDGSWTVENLPWRAENAEIQSGKYVYTLTATDKAGKTSKTEVNVLIDKAAPRITIKNPDNSYLKTAAIDRDEFTFAGTTEEDPEESGVASYSYVIKPRGSAKPELNDVDWITVPSSATNWSFIKKIGNDKEELKEGSWTLYVKAKDKAGNETLATDYVSVDFDVDKAAPVQSLSLNPVKENNIYDTTFSIGGKIHDTHGVEKVDVKILNAKTNEVVHTYESVKNITATSEPTENNLLQEITVGSEGAIKTDGSYIVEVTTTDKVGKVTENEYSIMVDREAPTVEISSIGDGDIISVLTKIEGAASDAASGVDTSSGRYVIKYN